MDRDLSFGHADTPHSSDGNQRSLVRVSLTMCERPHRATHSVRLDAAITLMLEADFWRVLQSYVSYYN
jgi:hypothetical protein